MLLDLFILLFTHLLIHLQMDNINEYMHQTNLNKSYTIIIYLYCTL